VTRTLTSVSSDLKRLAPGSTQGELALRELAAKFERSDRSQLAGIGLATTYAPATMLPEGKKWQRWLVTGLELARDTLIFVPVIYTWWRLSLALQAYDHYTGRAPFLLAWQDGFGNKTQRLSTSALVVAGVVASIIVLTVIAHMARTWYDGQVERRQQRLAALLAEASLLVNQSLLSGAPDVTKADLASIATRITSSTEALQGALTKAGADIVTAVNTSPGSKLHEMFEKWTAAANELKTLGTRLQGTQEMVDRLRDTQTALSNMSQQIGAETARLIKALEEERTASHQEAHAHHELATQVERSTQLLGQSLKGLNERSEQFNELVLRLQFIVDRLDGSGTPSRAPGGGYN
jgi:hypothetical protein